MARRTAVSRKPRQRRPKNTGTFFFSEARGVYVGRAIVGRKPDGSPHYAERSDATEAGLVAKLALVTPAGPETTVREWMTRWLADMDVRARTRAIRETAVEHYVNPTLGHIRLRDLTAQQIGKALPQWAATLNPTTVRMYLSALHTSMKAAQNAGVRQSNPVAGVKKPAILKKKIDPFTAAQLDRIIAEATKWHGARIAAFIAATGCRAGEALALDVASYDHATGFVTIAETQDEGRERGPTKTANGTRAFWLPPAALPAVLAAIGKRTSGPLFATITGRRSNHFNARNGWISLLTRLGLPYRNLHQLRHTIATLLLASGMPVGDVAAYLGDSPEAIMRTYCHPTGANVGDAVQRLLSGNRVGADSEGGDK